MHVRYNHILNPIVLGGNVCAALVQNGNVYCKIKYGVIKTGKKNTLYQATFLLKIPVSPRSLKYRLPLRGLQGCPGLGHPAPLPVLSAGAPAPEALASAPLSSSCSWQGWGPPAAPDLRARPHPRPTTPSGLRSDLTFSETHSSSRVRSLVGGDPTCHGTAKPAGPKRSHFSEKLEQASSRAAPACGNERKPTPAVKTQGSQKYISK